MFDVTTSAHETLTLDAVQATAAATAGPCVVLGGPGTGKTTTVLAWAARRLQAANGPDHGVVVLVPSRRGATRVRDLLSRRVTVTSRDPAVRTPHSLAWAVLRESALRHGQRPPRLLTGAESDLSLADLLAGHEAGEGGLPLWPDSMPIEVRALRAFRTDLRELWARLVERGHGPQRLAHLGRRHGRLEWMAAAAVLDERLRVIGLSGDNSWDPAEIVDEAAARLEGDDGLRRWAADRVRALAVDDAQDLTTAGWRLVGALGGGGADLLVTGDPDLATQTFRGARPAGLTAVADDHRSSSGDPAPVLVLPTVWRCPPVLADVGHAVAERIGVVTAVHRRPAARSTDGNEATARVVIFGDTTDEAAGIAGILRGWHHDPEEPVPWHRMAVIVRSLRRAESIRRAGAGLGVPVVIPGPGVPLRDQPAVVMLLRAGAVACRPEMMDAAVLRELACGPIGGSDSLRWQHLIRAARSASAGRHPADALAEQVRLRLSRADRRAVPDPAADWLGVSPRHARPVDRVHTVLAAARRQLQDRDQPESVLWALWQATGLARRWRASALASGADAGSSEDDLDAVMALFDAAAGFAERQPGAGMAAFCDHVAALGVADDRLSGAAVAAAVTVTTATGAVGLEFDAVVVAGVQDGVWPDLRVRGSLLHTAELVDSLDGRHGIATADQVRQTLDDELRLFHVAVTRARRHLVVTAVNGDDERPSELCRLVAGPGVDLTAAELPLPPSWHDHTLPSLVVALRRLIGAGAAPLVLPGMPPAPSPAAAAAMLARLAAQGVPGADPAQWWWSGAAPIPLGNPPAERPERAVTISASAVEAFSICPLRAYLSRLASDGGEESARRLGELIHRAAQRHPQGSAAELQGVVDAGWAELGIGEGWMAERLRRRAEVMVQRLADWMAGRPPPVATEIGFRMDLDGVTVAGTIDRLDEVGGPLVGGPLGTRPVQVIDYKTGAPHTKEAARENTQLGLYQMAVDRGLVADGLRSAGAALVHVGGTARAAAVRDQPRLTAVDAARVEEIVGRYADAIRSGEFPATPGSHCERCRVRTSCPVDPTGSHPLSLEAP